MFKKTLISVAMATAMFGAAGAFAAAAVVTQTSAEDTYAAELFGTGSNAVVLTTSAAAVTLTVSGAGGVDAGETADFTFTMVGGQFGQAVTLSDFVYSGAGGVTITKQSGGAVGDTTVVFRVQVTTALAATETLVFTPVKLQNASGLSDDTDGEVTLTTSIALVSTSGVNTFPTSITNAATANLIADSDEDVTLTATDGTDEQIDVSARETLVGGGVSIDHDDDNTTDPREAVEVAEVGYTVAGAALQSDGSAFSEATGEDGEGNLAVSVAGSFNTGDIVFVDLNANAIVDAGESLTISGSTASGSFELDADVASGSTYSVYYVLNGTDNASPTTFTTTVATSYTASTMAAESDTATAETTFSGLSDDGYSMALPGSGSADIANVRITNNTANEVTVFAQCYGQDGTNLGFEELITSASPLAAYETRVLNAAAFEAVFGTWSGRARCDFSASDDINVQTFVRSGGILNNMTANTDD